MKVINKNLLKEFREKVCCECCGKPSPQGLDPHHIFSKGAGRVDIRQNLISLCRPCHNGYHARGKPSRDELLEIAARREKTTPEEIEAFVMRVRADDKCKTWRVS